MQYTKKPITVEALVWTGENHREMYEFLGGPKGAHMSTENENFYIDHNIPDCGGLIIKTSEGVMKATIGDYVIKEPFDKERRYYPCKPDIFDQTYCRLDPDTVQFPLFELTKLQNHYGYVRGPIDPVALFGLFGEAGEVLGEAYLKEENNTDAIKAEDLKGIAISSAAKLDSFKKQLRNKEYPPIKVVISTPPAAFDTELADCFYYLHALAINRGLKLEDLAQISLDKIKAKEARQEALG